jgi:hypothetical protein
MTFIFSLLQNLAKYSYEWSPLWLPHKIAEKNIGTPYPTQVFLSTGSAVMKTAPLLVKLCRSIDPSRGTRTGDWLP